MNTIVSRRALLRTTALIPVAVVMACAGQSIPAVIQKAAQDASLIGSGLASVMPQLASITSAGTLAMAQSWLDKLNVAASQLATMPTTTAAQPVVQQIEQAVNAIVGVAAPLLAATPAGPILTAATVLLPVIEVAVGLVVAPAAGGMTADQARLILAGATRR